MSILKNYQPAKGTCKVTFSYPTNAAEGCKSVQVIGDFNNWDSKLAPVMKAGKNEFSTTIELSVGQTYEFKYLLDGSKWDNDHSSDSYVASPFDGINNSVLILDAATPKARPVANVAKVVAKPTVKPATTKTVTAPKKAKGVAKKPVAKKATPASKVVKTPAVKVTAKKAEVKVVAKTPAKSVTTAAPKAKTAAKKTTK
jgi:hypothetical protein